MAIPLSNHLFYNVIKDEADSSFAYSDELVVCSYYSCSYSTQSFVYVQGLTMFVGCGVWGLNGGRLTNRHRCSGRILSAICVNTSPSLLAAVLPIRGCEGRRRVTLHYSIVQYVLTSTWLSAPTPVHSVLFYPISLRLTPRNDKYYILFCFTYKFCCLAFDDFEYRVMFSTCWCSHFLKSTISF